MVPKTFYTVNYTKGNELTRLFDGSDKGLVELLKDDLALMRELRQLTDETGSHQSKYHKPGEVGEHKHGIRVVARLPERLIPFLFAIEPDFLKDKKILWKTIRQFRDVIGAYTPPEGRG